MCKCDPNIKAPFCGKPGCQWPEQNLTPIPTDVMEAAAERRRRCHEVWDDHELAMGQVHDRLAEIYGVSPIIDILDLQLKIAEDASVLADAYLRSPPRDLFDAVCEVVKRVSMGEQCVCIPDLPHNRDCIRPAARKALARVDAWRKEVGSEG